MWLFVLLIPWPLILILNHGLVDTTAHLIAYDCGIIAYVWWLTIIVLATRPKWLIQQIGMPTLYAVHGALGVMALLAATIHRLTSFSMFPLIRLTGNSAWYLEIFSVIFASVFLSGWLTDRIPKIARLKKIGERHLFKHQVTIWLHRLNFLAIGLIWLHVLVIPRFGSIFGFTALINVYTLAAISIYCSWKIRIRRQQQGIIKENKTIDEQMQQILIALPDHTEYHAGDFYFLSFQKRNGLFSEPHPFSVVTAPTYCPGEALFMIRRLGDFTSQLNQVPVGTCVRMEGPFGLFDQEIAQYDGPIILYGMGAGIAPLLSLARQYADKKKIHLLWTGSLSKTDEFQKTLQQLTEQGAEIWIKDHRFSDNELKQLFSSDEIQNARLIMVGNSAAVLSMRHRLQKIGFKNRQLIDERITL